MAGKKGAAVFCRQRIPLNKLGIWLLAAVQLVDAAVVQNGFIRLRAQNALYLMYMYL